MNTVEKSGGNGNVYIDYQKGTAIKSLKPNKGKESQIRYKKEMQALQQIAKESIPNVVEIISIDESKREIVMKAYKGDLTDIYNLTKNNPLLCAGLLLPVVKSLKKLAVLDVPIYHRDLKPANILYDLEGETPSLYISDFGCCYFEQDDNRQTPLFRAVGAQSYRAPEYDYGRVEEITTKGDVYSLGKILWAMINGVRGEVFPYTLWFPSEYNLLNRFPQTPALVYTNLIVAKCVSINPDERPTYDELIEMLYNVGDPSVTVSAEKQLKVKVFSAQRDYELVEIRELNRSMLILFHQCFATSLSNITKSYDGFSLLTHLNTEYEKTLKYREHDIEHKVSTDAASYVFSTSFDNIYFAVHYHPTYSLKNGSPDDKYARISMEYRIASSGASDSISIAYKNKSLQITHNNISTPFNGDGINTFLENMVDAYIVSFR